LADEDAARFECCSGSSLLLGGDAGRPDDGMPCDDGVTRETVVKVITTGFLLALVAGAIIKLKVFGGGQ
jgi:hypothetical protein